MRWFIDHVSKVVVKPNADVRKARRYFLVQKARDAEIVGVLIGTLSASQRKPMLSSLNNARW